MFAVGWGANQFSPMLIVYRHALGLGPGELAGLFTVYGVALIPGLLIGGPSSDRFGRRAVVLPFAALSPVATLLLVLGPHSIAMITVGRALAGVCSGVVFGSATAWVQDLSHGDALSARRAALALSAGFALGPVTAAVLAQWAGDPLVVPFLPHLAIGVVAFAIAVTTPGTVSSPAGRHWPPAAVRTRRFWLTVAPPAPVVFGAVALAIVVLPEEVTSAGTMSVGYAGLMTALTFAGGIGIQPAARRLAARREHAGIIAGLAATVAGAAVGVAAVATASRILAGAAAVFLGLAYGLCLVSGLSQAERLGRLAGDRDRGAVVACYYVLTYLGFGVPYVVDALNGPLGRPGTFAALTGGAAVLTAWTGLQAARRRSESRFDLSRTVSAYSRTAAYPIGGTRPASVGAGADDGWSDDATDSTL
jgi:predicted MFS family arabinose efflux permease